MKTQEEIEKALNEILDSKIESQRKIVMYTGCKTYGFINVMEKCCNDPECTSCNRFLEALKKESENWVFYE